MSERRCPLCGQPLPEALTSDKLDSRIRNLASPLIAGELARNRKELESRLKAERVRAQQNAERKMRTQLDAVQKQAERAKAQHERELEKMKNTAEQRVRKEISDAVRQAARESSLKLEKLQAQRERDSARHAAEIAGLQGKLDTLSRKLEKQSGERLGEEGEIDLLAALERAFPKDRVERIGRGKRGADIVQNVIDGGQVVGRIVYENKNVTVWANSFITQATKYRTQYDTPYVMIVSRAFPRKQKDFAILGGIPIVCPRMAVGLASVMRDAIAAIGRLRLSEAGRDQKAVELMQYLTSDQFATRFKGIAECVEDLRKQQTKERDWHERSWQSQSDLHDRIAKHHREVNAQLEKTLTSRRPMAVAARA